MQASERLNAVAWLIADSNRAVSNVAEIAPDLAPELLEIQNRLTQVFEHLTSGINVVTAKVSLLTLEVEEGESQ